MKLLYNFWVWVIEGDSLSKYLPVIGTRRVSMEDIERKKGYPDRFGYDWEVKFNRNLM